jgi:hypothetical protein
MRTSVCEAEDTYSASVTEDLYCNSAVFAKGSGTPVHVLSRLRMLLRAFSPCLYYLLFCVCCVLYPEVVYLYENSTDKYTGAQLSINTGTECTRCEVHWMLQLSHLYSSHLLHISHILLYFHVFRCHENSVMWYLETNFHFPCWLIWSSISRRAVWSIEHVSHTRLPLAEPFH